ncbi:hypothetical protein FRC17_003034 [Serendipita sp. 399]|nr:hypothetical protein FRC17_003034 [Serendipita sp. 399]
MESLVPRLKLPVSTPTPGVDNLPSSQREDGSFDLTHFLANFDTNSEFACYLDSFDPARFLALLKCAASSPPHTPGSALIGRFKRRKSEPSQEDVTAYQLKLESREQAKIQLNQDLEALERVVNEMEKDRMPGVHRFKHEFRAAKTFILNAIQNPDTRILDIHLEYETSPATPGVPIPPSPRLGTIPLPGTTPVASPVPSGMSTPLSPTQKWPSILLGPTGFAYRIIATPRDIESDATSYFQPRSTNSVSAGTPLTPTTRRSRGSETEAKPDWLRRLSGFGTTPSH